MELAESAFHFVGQATPGSGQRRPWAVVVSEHIEKAVVLAFHKGSVNRDMTARHLERVGNLLNRNVESLGEFLGRRTALVLLLELRQGFCRFC